MNFNITASFNRKRLEQHDTSGNPKTRKINYSRFAHTMRVYKWMQRLCAILQGRFEDVAKEVEEMTAQVGDCFRYKGNQYSIVAISEPIQFNPRDYGIVPEAICTACWNGYWCEYNISEEGIFLQNLYINSKDDQYPEICGVKVNNTKKGSHMYMGHHLYKNINLPIPYSGKIVVGEDFMREYYIHMGYQRAWAYKVLLEFVFENGVLKETLNHSKMAARLREEMTKDNGGNCLHCTEEDVCKFIEESFSLELNSKAWWIC